MANIITFDDWRELSHITFESADSYDSKEFDRLAAVLAPQVTLDYSEQPLAVKHKLTADQFVKLSSNANRLGGIVDCTHHVGASKFERTGPDTVTGHQQVFVEYKRYKNMEKKGDEVEATGEGLTMMLHYYQKVDGKWKLEGVKPRVRMSQFNFPEIFKEPQQKDTKKSKL